MPCTEPKMVANAVAASSVTAQRTRYKRSRRPAPRCVMVPRNAQAAPESWLPRNLNVVTDESDQGIDRREMPGLLGGRSALWLRLQRLLRGFKRIKLVRKGMLRGGHNHHHHLSRVGRRLRDQRR